MRQASDGGYRWHLAWGRPMKDKDGNILCWFGSMTDIDDQKRTEEELRKNRAILRATIDNLPFDFFALGMDGRYILQNATSKAHWGDAVGKRAEDTAGNEENLVLWRENNRRAFAGEKVEEEVTLTIKGEKRYYYNVIAPIIDAGQIQGILGLNVDRTERKRAEEALRQAHDELERRVKERTAALSKANEDLAVFRRFADAAGQGFGIASLDGRIAYVNPFMCRLLGENNPEDLVGKHLAQYFSPEQMRRRETEVLPALMRTRHWQGEIVLSRPDGSLSVLQNSFLIHEGETPAYLATVFTDITERRQAEAALRQSHDELQAIYDQAVDGIIIADAERVHPVRANPAYCRWLGYSEEEAYSLSPQRLHPPEVLPKVWDHLEQAKQGMIARIEDLPFLRKDGSVVYADVVSSRIRYNQRPCWISFFHDVTERKQAQEALQREHRTLRHLLQSSDHERQLIAYDIHDGLAQYLVGAIMQFQVHEHLREAKPEEAAKAYAAGMTMLRQGQFEARRLISGVRPPILDEAGVVAAISHLVNEQKQQDGPKIAFRTSVEFDRLVPILENAIYRITQEALANACRHSKSASVLVTLVQHREGLRIEVRDRGVGFNPDDIGESRFGLAGIRERARLLGGRATIKSKLGKGTRVVVELPIVVRKAGNEV